jgi:hypothetical protein
MATPPAKRPVSDTKASKAPPKRLPPPPPAKASAAKPPARPPPKRPAEPPAPPPKEEPLDLDEGWSAPPPSIRLSGPPSRRLKASLAPMEVDPAWVSLHSIAPAPVSVRMPAAAKKGPPPLPPPPKLTIPVESNWIDEEVQDDPDAAARAALLRPKGAKPPPIPRMPKK